MNNDQYYPVKNMCPFDNGLNDPVGLCITDNRWYNNSNIIGPSSQRCRKFMAKRCALKWDGKCELACGNNSRYVPSNTTPEYTAEGVELVYNVLLERYFHTPENNLCRKTCELFDATAPYSPKVCSYEGCGCERICHLPNDLNILKKDRQLLMATGNMCDPAFRKIVSEIMICACNQDPSFKHCEMYKKCKNDIEKPTKPTKPTKNKNNAKPIADVKVNGNDKKYYQVDCPSGNCGDDQEKAFKITIGILAIILLILLFNRLRKN